MKGTRTITMKGKPLVLEGEGLAIGELAPGFTVLGRDLKTVQLSQFSGKIKVISVTPSLDTPVCDVQLRRFNGEAASLPADVVVMNISMDLPFAIDRFCVAAGIDRVVALSDHRDAAFGTAFGVLIKELRLLARSVFILDKDDRVRYMEIVPEVSDHPDYEAALRRLKELVEVRAAA
jgi:thiol peroxidase